MEENIREARNFDLGENNRYNSYLIEGIQESIMREMV